MDSDSTSSSAEGSPRRGASAVTIGRLRVLTSARACAAFGVGRGLVIAALFLSWALLAGARSATFLLTALVALPLIYASAGALFGLLLALGYNATSPRIGGFEVELEVSPPPPAGETC